MDGIQMNSITAAGNAAAARVSSALTGSSVGMQRTVGAKTAAAGSSSDGSGSGTGNTSNISANDFLTLLVSELKNQDPTQPQDPNAYVQQLVGVNSLQQLIQINQGLTTIEPSNTTSTPV